MLLSFKQKLLFFYQRTGQDEEKDLQLLLQCTQEVWGAQIDLGFKGIVF